MNSKDRRENISIFELTSMAEEEYYSGKQKRHDSIKFKLRSVLFALVSQDWYPEFTTKLEIKNYIIRRKLAIGKEVNKDIDRLLAPLTDKIVEYSNGYRLRYKVTRPVSEKDFPYYLKSERPDLSFILPLIENILDDCKKIMDYYREGKF